MKTTSLWHRGAAGTRLSWTRAALLGSAAFVLLAAAACQVIGDIHGFQADPIVQGCALPSSGDAKLRIANMAPGTVPIDLCVRSSGASYDRPILRDSGTSCPVGTPFEKVTVPFGTASGTLDFRAIAAGSTCSAAAIAELDGVTIAKGSTSTVLVAGGTGTTATLAVLPEGPVSSAPDAIFLRFVDAIGGAVSLVFGNASNAPPPATVTPLTTSVPFGRAPTAQSTVVGAVDANGYLATSNIPLVYGAALPGTTNAILAIQPPRETSSFSLFAAGDLANTRYPVRGILCDEKAAADATGVFVPCTASSPPSIAAAVFNTALYGAYAPEWELRHDLELSTIAANAASLDVLCLAEIGSAADQQALITQALPNFPYSAVANTTLASAITNPTDLNGTAQSPPTQAPCSDPNVAPKAQSAFNCILGNCADPGTGALATSTDPSAVVSVNDCVSDKCTLPLAQLLNGGAAGGACFDCIIGAATSYEPLAHAQDECTTSPQAGYAFDGQTPTMILSRYPLTNVSVYVLPSYMYRRSFIRAEMQVDTTAVDVYCGQLTFIQGSLTPYEGAFGAGPSDPSGGWANEQDNQAQQLVAFVQASSKGRPAIVMGEFASNTQYPAGDIDAGAITIGETNPTAITTVRSAFVEAIAADYTPACTSCAPPANPFNGTGPGSWSNRIFTYNFPSNAGIESQIIFNQSIVPNPGGSPSTLPLSDSFAYEASLLRPTSQ